MNTLGQLRWLIWFIWSFWGAIRHLHLWMTVISICRFSLSPSPSLLTVAVLKESLLYFITKQGIVDSLWIWFKQIHWSISQRASWHSSEEFQLWSTLTDVTPVFVISPTVWTKVTLVCTNSFITPTLEQRLLFLFFLFPSSQSNNTPPKKSIKSFSCCHLVEAGL